MADPLFPYDMAITGFVKLRLIGRSPMPDPLRNLCSTCVGRNAAERMDDTGGNDHRYKPNRQYSFSTHKLPLYVEYPTGTSVGEMTRLGKISPLN